MFSPTIKETGIYRNSKESYFSIRWAMLWWGSTFDPKHFSLTRFLE